MKKNDKKKEKFTPGPWFTMFGNHVHSHGNGFVARATDSPLGPAANRANANLIAAAPEMYELLDRIKGMLEFCKLENSIDAETEHEIDRLLAKARGEVQE